MRDFMKALIVLGFLFSVVAAADTPPSLGHWKGNAGELEIKTDAVIVNGEKYPFDKEIISQAHGVSSDAKALCYAQTLTAVKKGAHIVLVKTYRSKPSKSAGILCTFSKDISKYSDPYSFRQYVLLQTNQGRLLVQDYFIMNGPASEVSLTEMKNPDLSVTNPKIREYLERNQGNFHASSFFAEFPILTPSPSADPVDPTK
jgi:hypothetical protein